VFAAAIALLASACAVQPGVVRFGNEQVGLSFPSPPEAPRFEYLGELTGEANIEVGAAARSWPTRMVRWLVGLTSNAEKERNLSRPQSGLFDPRSGRNFVTDVGRHAVFVFDESGGELSIWDQASASTGFVTPIAIAQGSEGEVLVTDAELGVWVRLSSKGAPLGIYGQGLLKRPTGIARDPLSGDVYVADTHSHDVKVFDAQGAWLRTLGRKGSAPGEFNSPTHLALRDGKLYVTDTLNSRVQILKLNGDPLKSVGERGLFLGNLPRPKGVAVEENGQIYVVESFYDYLLVYDADGQFLLPVGGTGSDPGQFYLPSGVWTDGAGRVFVADTFNSRVVALKKIPALRQ